MNDGEPVSPTLSQRSANSHEGSCRFVHPDASAGGFRGISTCRFHLAIGRLLVRTGTPIIYTSAIGAEQLDDPLEIVKFRNELDMVGKVRCFRSYSRRRHDRANCWPSAAHQTGQRQRIEPAGHVDVGEHDVDIALGREKRQRIVPCEGLYRLEPAFSELVGEGH